MRIITIVTITCYSIIFKLQYNVSMYVCDREKDEMRERKIKQNKTEQNNNNI